MKLYIQKLIYYSLFFICNILYSKSFIHNNTQQTVIVSFVYKNVDSKSLYKCTKESTQTVEIAFREKISYEEATGTCMLIQIKINGKENSARVTIENPPLQPSVIDIGKPTVEKPGTFTWSIRTE